MAKWIRVRLPRSVLRPVDASHVPVTEPTVKRNSSREDLERDSINRGDGDGGDDDVVDSDGVIYALPAWETLESGSTIRWPLWFHPNAVGRTAVRICVCYQPEPPAPKLLRYRTIRIFESVEVTPSMRVSAMTIPSPSHPLARVIRLSIASGREQTDIFKLGSVRLGSSKDRVKYELIPLMKHATAPRLIAPGETIETLIKCSPSEEANAKELLNFVDAIPEESAKPLFAFHNSFKKNDAKRALKVRNEAITDGLMITWSLKGGDVVGAQHVRNVVELTRCTDTTRTPNELKSKVTWTINYASTIKLDETAPGNMTYSSVTLPCSSIILPKLPTRRHRRPPTLKAAAGLWKSIRTRGKTEKRYPQARTSADGRFPCRLANLLCGLAQCAASPKTSPLARFSISPSPSRVSPKAITF